MSRKATKFLALLLSLLMLASMPAAAFEGNSDTSCVYSWVGNDFNGQEDENEYGNQILHELGGMFVTPDGRVFTNCVWEEDGHNFEEIKDGKLVKNGGYSHGWGYQGGMAVTANDKYVYFSQRVENEGGGLYERFPTQYPPTDNDWQGIQRRLLSDIQVGAGFEGGTGRAGGAPESMSSSFLPILTGPVKETHITGLACDNERLYVASYTANKIFVFDAETMEQKDEWDVEGANTIALDKNGILWVNQLTTGTILSFNSDGTKRDVTITFDEGVRPWALCVDNYNRLMISDHGPKEWIMVYDGLDGTPKLSHTIGQEGGIYAGTPGLVEDMKFKHVTGLGVDAEDNIYVGNAGMYYSDGITDPRTDGQCYIECYDKDGNKLWDVHGLAFVDGMKVDEQEQTKVYSESCVFTMDFNKSPGEEWSYYAYTIDQHRFPDDPRFHTESITFMNVSDIVYPEGQRLMFTIDMDGESLGIYRFDPENYGEIAIPCAFFHHQLDKPWPKYSPDYGYYAWIDANGDGQMDENEFNILPMEYGWGRDWTVAQNGDLYRCSDDCAVYYFPFKGFNEHGVPEWDLQKMKPITLGEKYEGYFIRRVTYESETDTMYMTILEPGTECGWREAGNILTAFSNWSDDAKRKELYAVKLPLGEKHFYTNMSDMPQGLDVAGDYVFVGYNSRPLTYIFDKKTGELYDMIIPPFEIGKHWGLVDIAASYKTVKLDNGEYAIAVEDDLKSKNWIIRWTDKGGPKNYNENKTLAVAMDNRQLVFADQEPLIISDRTMVPMRYIFQALDAEVTWDAENRIVTGTKGDKSVVLTIDSNVAVINGVETELDVAAQIVNDRTMVPLRVVAEGLGVKVDWLPEESLVNITTDKAIIKGYGEPIPYVKE